MKLDVKAFTLAFAIVWAAILLFAGIANIVFASYGEAFLSVIASIYPGYNGYPTVSQVIILVLYGLVDGAVGGFLFAVAYNYFLKPKR